MGTGAGPTSPPVRMFCLAALLAGKRRLERAVPGESVDRNRNDQIVSVQYRHCATGKGETSPAPPHRLVSTALQTFNRSVFAERPRIEVESRQTVRRPKPEISAAPAERLGRFPKRNAMQRQVPARRNCESCTFADIRGPQPKLGSSVGGDLDRAASPAAGKVRAGCDSPLNLSARGEDLQPFEIRCASGSRRCRVDR